MSFIDTPQITSLERFLDIAGVRHTLIASNLANVDTPGYRTRDIHFREELDRALQGLSSANETPQSYDVPGLIERPDGNNVSVDREGLLLAQTQLQFNVGIELLREQFRLLQTAINEGRQA